MPHCWGIDKKEQVMEPIKLNYEPLKAAIGRGDQAHIEAYARKLRGQYIAQLILRAVARARSVTMAIGRGGLARRIAER